MNDSPPYWERKSLAEMTRAEWEGLCDGCGRCCLHKLEDVDTGAIAFTDIACTLLDLGSCRCRDYDDRHATVPDCVTLNSVNVYDLAWLPDTCAYKILAEGKPLHWWHPLVSGDPETVHEAGISVRGKARSEDEIDGVDADIEHWLNRGNRPLWVLPGTKAKRPLG